MPSSTLPWLLAVQAIQLEDGPNWFGRVANAAFILVFVGLAIGVVIAWRRGAFKSDEEQFKELGYVPTRALGAVKPNVWLLAALGGFALILYPLFAFLIVLAIRGEWLVLLFLLVLVPGIVVHTLFITYGFLRLWVDRRVSKLMQASGTTPSPVTESAAVGDGRAPVRVGEGATRLELIDPPTPDRVRKARVTGTANVLGSDPIRILYLWNFDTGWATMPVEVKNWRQYGPVYLLQSPRFLPMTTYFRLIVGDPNDYFASDSDDLDRLLAGADERPLGPGLRGGRYGRYPRIWVPCSDAAWRLAVARLCAYVDAVVLDARGYSRERDGLSWEMRHVVSSVPRRRFVIMSDVTTDVAEVERQVLAVDEMDEPRREPVRVIHKGWGEIWGRRPADDIVEFLTRGAYAG